MRVTLQDIARLSCVSITTVSRVLNNHPRVHEATRAHVWQIARELHYPMGKGLDRERQNRSVLVVTTTPILNEQITSNYEQFAFEGARSVLMREGYTVTCHHACIESRSALASNAHAGVLMLGGTINRSLLERFIRDARPLVIAGAHVKPLQVNCVLADIADGIDQAVKYLVAKGRRHIGLVNGPCTTTSSTDKYRAFRLALDLYDLYFNDAQVVSGDFTTTSGYHQTARLLAQTPDLDAIVYAGDHMALGGLKTLKDAGYRIPSDVAVVGFYDFELARFSNPPLTSIQFDIKSIGVLAAQRLLTLLEQPDGQICYTLVPTKLVVRKSS